VQPARLGIGQADFGEVPVLVPVPDPVQIALAVEAAVQREARRRALGSSWRVEGLLARRALQRRGVRRCLVGVRGLVARLGLVRRECELRAKRGSRNFLKRFIFFFSWSKVAVALEKTSCTCEQKWDSASTSWPRICCCE
jgi:hypothetical protein